MLSPVTYLQESLEELRHVRWPTRQQAVKLSIIVIAFVAVSAAAFGAIDFLLSQGVSFILPSF